MYSRRIRFRQAQQGIEPLDDSSPARKQAVALGYDSEKDIAPRVLASGKGVFAEQIIALAQANDIAIREDPLLAAALANVEVDSLIPPELYAVVAEVLAYVYRVSRAKHG